MVVLHKRVSLLCLIGATITGHSCAFLLPSGLSFNHARQSTFSLKSTSVSNNVDLEMLPEIRSTVFEKDGGEQAWTESTEIIKNALYSSFSTDQTSEVELVLATAFSWKAYVKASPMMRKYQNPKLPDPTQIQQAIEWLRTGPLELPDDVIRDNIQAHPKTFLMDPQSSYKKAISSAPRKYRDPSVFKQALETDPTVLQVTYNCADDGCISECGSCWVTYRNRLAFGDSI